ncbi:hypothetical protein [Streptomyces sp. NPDC050856]|uniref:hypothetical protein n=1 Tax=Streptomyces sp. NPDC050856 TaxID=3154939 RepID=UPI0033DDF8B2
MGVTVGWTAAGAGEYEVALDAHAEPKPVVRCRRAATGRELKRLPPALRARRR